MFARHLLLVLVVAATASACGSGSPQGALEGYAEAVEANDADAAYELLGEAFHDRVDRETFQERFDAQHAAGPDFVEILEDAADGPAFVEAKLPYTEFDTLEMTLTRDGWRFDRGLFNFYGQRTPREALHSFVKALERRKYDVLMRFVPSDYAEHMTATDIQAQFEANPARIEEMIALLRQHKDNVIEVRAPRAWMEYGPYRIDFVKQEGVWKVEDPD